MIVIKIRFCNGMDMEVVCEDYDLTENKLYTFIKPIGKSEVETTNIINFDKIDFINVSTKIKV